ncbi:MAG TPA: alpha-xylosidase [Fimbriimonas sp.]|nr:alpha-xylosidase [Fimbriimonas sp.]
MKFTDGAWMMREGVKAHYAAEAYELWQEGQTLRIIAPTHNIRHRGDTLGGANLTVTITSPMPDVIGVKLVHFEGVQDKGPHFELYPQEIDPSIEIDKEKAVYRSGGLTAKINRQSYSVEFEVAGKTIVKSPWRGAAYVEVDGKGPFVSDQLSLGVGENVYGLGERFTAFIKNGQVVDIWNKDGGTDSEQAYKNIPFYLTNRGYGVFVNHSGQVSYEIATEKVSRVQFSAPGESLEYFVIYGPTPKEVLQKYTALTGRPALPPAWSFGLWLTTSFTTNYDEETVTSFIQGMADRDLPLHVFHFDCFWMKGFHWTDLEWDPEVFPDPKAMLARLKERGLHICAWINPYIAQASKLFREGVDKGYLLKRPNGDVWQWDMWQPGMGIVDFTNPYASDWFSDLLADLIDMGVDSLKTDFGERIPIDVQYFDGSDPERMHNYYPQLYNKVAFEVLERKLGKGEAALFARSATAGGQKYPVHWGGDCWSEFEAMAESLRGGLSLGLSGFGFWSHDIGGFEGLPPAALYKRWVAFGLLSSHSRLHGSSSYRVPWLYDDEAVETVRFFTKLKCRLMPYLFQAAVEAHKTGIPVMRPMMLEFPSDPACATLDQQYMLGERLMVAPVFSYDNRVQYYVPEGRWTNFITGNEVVGPRWVDEEHGFLSAALLVRPNSVIPVGAVDTRPDYDYAEGLTFQLFAVEGEVNVSVPDLKGNEAGKFSATVRDGRLKAEVSENIRDWKVVVDRSEYRPESGERSLAK